MKFSGKVVGDDGNVERDFDEAITRINSLPSAMDKGADKLVIRAKQIARSKGLDKTGAGISGIIYEKENDDRLIGWSSRPNFHLYFQEIGTYKDYPRPHVRPAADQTEHEIIEDIRKNVVGD